MGCVTVTRVVHASVLLDFDGIKILTDPWFSERTGYYHGEPLGIALADLPPLDCVLVSHDHYDHNDMEAFHSYPDKDVLMVVKRGAAGPARKAGFRNIVEIDPWEETVAAGVRITATPAEHGVPENSYVLEGAGTTVFFGGDTLLIPELGEIAHRFPNIDLALLSVNGLMLRPLLNRQVVMSAREAAQLCAMLRPRVVVPMHYAFTAGAVRDHLLLKYNGTASSFAASAHEWAPGSEVRVLAPGEPLVVSGGYGKPGPHGVDGWLTQVGGSLLEHAVSNER
jgi:L-ascorbate metabolism protein UlaG (beta-lactamase superfamily)